MVRRILARGRQILHVLATRFFNARLPLCASALSYSDQLRGQFIGALKTLNQALDAIGEIAHAGLQKMALRVNARYPGRSRRAGGVANALVPPARGSPICSGATKKA